MNFHTHEESEVEPIENAALVCSKCAPQPGRYTNLPVSFFIGRDVKVMFEGRTPIKNELKKEHMWVTIYGNDGEMLLGNLKNTPVLIYDGGLENGAIVRMSVHDVEDVYGLEN